MGYDGLPSGYIDLSDHHENGSPTYINIDHIVVVRPIALSQDHIGARVLLTGDPDGLVCDESPADVLEKIKASTRIEAMRP